jgi:hypothetical protein
MGRSKRYPFSSKFYLKVGDWRWQLVGTVADGGGTFGEADRLVDGSGVCSFLCIINRIC